MRRKLKYIGGSCWCKSGFDNQRNRENHQGSCRRVKENVKGGNCLLNTILLVMARCFHSLCLKGLFSFGLKVEDSELADVAAVSAGNNYEVGNMIAEAMAKVGRKGVVTLEEGKSAENSLYVVEGMQFDRGYMSPYFVTDSEKMSAEYENCKVINTVVIS